MFFEQDNQKLLKEVKKENPELYKKVTIEEEKKSEIIQSKNNRYLRKNL